MSKLRVTLTSKPGLIPIGAAITLQKEPTNAFDNEAISVVHENAHFGYVAAFYKLRKVGTISAGRLVDKIPDCIDAVVVADQVAEVEVEDESEVVHGFMEREAIEGCMERDENFGDQ